MIDWGSFNLRHALRLLFSRNEAVVRRTLRKLHLRWFHASVTQMTRLLRQAGAPEAAIRLIAEVCDTCRICRTWARPAPSVRTAIRSSTRFNAAVQADLLFYADETGSEPQCHILLHMVDECIKWTVAVKVESKSAEELLTAMTVHWIQPFGPPTMLVWDGESGITSEAAGTWADRWNIDLVIRPPGKKAWLAERHHEILRSQLHHLQSQLQAENASVPFAAVLASAVFAKNAMLNTGSGTPYASLFGRTPALPRRVLDNLIGKTGCTAACA